MHCLIFRTGKGDMEVSEYDHDHDHDRFFWSWRFMTFEERNDHKL